MGRHRKDSRRGLNGSADTIPASGLTLHTRSRRRIAAWPVVSLVLIGLTVAGWFGWSWAAEALEHRAEEQAKDCHAGQASVHLAVTPEMEHPIRSAADRWEKQRGVIHDHCIRMDIRSAPSDNVLNDLLDAEPTGALAEKPTAWIPTSSAWVERLTEQQPDSTTANSHPLASDSDDDYPYLPLTGNADDVQQRAVQSFRTYLLEPEQQAEFEKAELQRSE